MRKRKPATVNNALAAVDDFYIRRGLGPASAARAELPAESQVSSEILIVLRRRRCMAHSRAGRSDAAHLLGLRRTPPSLVRRGGAGDVGGRDRDGAVGV